MANAFVGVFLVGLAVFLRIPVLLQPIDRDLGTYATIGDLIRHGYLPYRDLFDHKQPLIYIVYWFLATIAPRSTFAIRLAAGLTAGLAGSLVFLLLCRSLGWQRALLAAGLAIIIGASRFVEGSDLNTEHLLALVACAAVIVPFAYRQSSVWWLPFVSGVLCGLAVLTKVVGILSATCALIPLTATRRARHQSLLQTLVAYVVGVAVPIAILVIFYALLDGLPEFLYANFTYNVQYVVLGPSRSLADWLDFGPELNLLLLSGLAIAAIRIVSNRCRDLLAWTFLAWLVGTLVGGKLGGRDFPHYFAPIVLPAAILVCLPAFSEGSRGHWTHAIMTLSIVVIICFPFVHDIVMTYRLSPDELVMRLYGNQARPWLYLDDVGNWLRAQADSGDHLFVAYAEPGFYWASGLQPASRYLYDYPDQFEPDFDMVVSRELSNAPPRFVVLPFFSQPGYLEILKALPYQETARFSSIRIYELLTEAEQKCRDQVLLRGVTRNVLMSLDFSQVVTDGAQNYAVTQTGQKVQIEGAVQLVDGPWEGSQALAIGEMTTNLIQNSSFETSLTAWWEQWSSGTATMIRTSDDDAVHGNVALKSVTSSGTNHCYLSTPDIGVGEKTFSAWVRADTECSAADQKFGLEANGNPITWFDVGTSWKMVQITQTPSGDNNAFHIRIAPETTMYLDDIQLEARTVTQLEVDADGSFDYASDHTVLVWVKLSHGTGGCLGYPAVFHYGTYYTDNSISLMFNCADGYLGLWAKDNAGSWEPRNQIDNPDAAIDDFEGGEWYQVGYRYDASENQVDLIWDGEIEVSNTGAAWPSALGSANNSYHKFGIGCRPNDGGFQLNGLVALFATFDRFLTTSELAALYRLDTSAIR